MKNCKKTLDSFEKRKFSVSKRETTFFDISGYPHYENVASNILKFFFDDNEEHQFGNLWLKSLLQVYNAKTSGHIFPEDVNGVKSVIREFSSDKRIDLLIECESFLVVIENKILAGLYNDLSLYTSMAEQYRQGLEVIKIVLSLNRKNHQLVI